MLAIGGAIGVGLFLGSGYSIKVAGPAVILAYLFGALIAIVVSYCLVEMVIVHPVAGSFGVYAHTYLGSWAGFSVRATYGICQMIAIGAEVTAVGIYARYWLPHVPSVVWVAAASIALVAINTMQVGGFGEFEYWFALIKVIAIMAFIVIGVGLIVGFGRGPALGLSNFTAHGGFMPHGLRGVWLSLPLAATSYFGVEVIAVTAGEAKNPKESVPRAARAVVYRLILFYLLSICVMLAMTPWDRVGSNLLSSPFVSAFSSVGISHAATIMNLVVIAAALSSCNTDLYVTTRMLFSLAREEYLPRSIGILSRNGVPHRALGVSTGGMIAAILLAIYVPSNAFLMLYGTALAGMFFVWIIILVTHLRFRKTLTPELLAGLPMRVALFPYSTIFGIVGVLAIALSTFYVDGMRYCVPTFVPFLLAISIVYWWIRRSADVCIADQT